jgi:cytoskeletal protein RodZ
MTNPGSSPEPRKEGFKSLIVKGVAASLALAGTTGIPILVKQSLEKPPEPVASPSIPVVSPSTPAAASSPMPSTTSVPDPSNPAQLQPVMEGTVTTPNDPEEPDGKHKPKKKKDKKE